MSKDFPHPFSALSRNYRRFRRELPAIVSNMAVNEFKTAFTTGGLRGEPKWKPRRKARNGRDASRAILVKSGRLKRSLRPMPTYDYARVVTNVPYAEAHNEGFKGTVTVKGHRRHKYKTTKVKKAGAKRSTTMKERTSYTMVKTHRRKMNLPARPFMKTTKPLLDDIDKYVLDKLDQIFSK